MSLRKSDGFCESRAAVKKNLEKKSKTEDDARLATGMGNDKWDKLDGQRCCLVFSQEWPKTRKHEGIYWSQQQTDERKDRPRWIKGRK